MEKKVPTKPGRAKTKPADSVDAFVATLDKPWGSAIDAFRAALLGSGNGCTERIKWNAPSFCWNGDDRVTFRITPRAVQLVFHRGAKVKDTAGFVFADSTGLLQWAAPDRGVITFAEAGDLTANVDRLARLANEWGIATADRVDR